MEIAPKTALSPRHLSWLSERPRNSVVAELILLTNLHSIPTLQTYSTSVDQISLSENLVSCIARRGHGHGIAAFDEVQHLRQKLR